MSILIKNMWVLAQFVIINCFDVFQAFQYLVLCIIHPLHIYDLKNQIHSDSSPSLQFTSFVLVHIPVLASYHLFYGVAQKRFLFWCFLLVY